MKGISIIIPNYNKEKYIEKCVDSVQRIIREELLKS